MFAQKNVFAFVFSCCYLMTLIYHVDTKAQFQIIGKKFECLSDSELIANMTCDLRHHNSTVSLWSADVYFKENVLIETLDVKLSWFYKTANDIKFKPFLGLSNVTIDLCQYLIHGNSMLVDMFLDEFKKNSNLIHPCPFKGHCYFKDVSPSVKRFPAIIPTGAYYMWFLFYTKSANKNADDLLFNMKMHVDVKTTR